MRYNQWVMHASTLPFGEDVHDFKLQQLEPLDKKT